MFNFNFEKCMEEILVEDNDPTERAEAAVSTGSDSGRVEVDLAENSLFTPQSCSMGGNYVLYKNSISNDNI